MPGALMIRSVAPMDFAQWAVLWEGYNKFYGRSGLSALPDEITKLTCRLLGIAHYLFHRSTTMIEPICYLQDLFTVEAARGQGIGCALIESVYERARAAKSPRVYWQTHETNLAAMKLYDKVAERSGFVVYRKNL